MASEYASEQSCWMCGSSPIAQCPVIPSCWEQLDPDSAYKACVFPELLKRNLLPRGLRYSTDKDNQVPLCPTCQVNFTSNPPNVFFIPTDLDILLGWNSKRQTSSSDANRQRTPTNDEYLVELIKRHGLSYPEYTIYIAKKYRPIWHDNLHVPGPLPDGRRWHGAPIAAVLKAFQILQKPIGLPPDILMKLSNLSHLWFIENNEFKITANLSATSTELVGCECSKAIHQAIQGDAVISALQQTKQVSSQSACNQPLDSGISPLIKKPTLPATGPEQKQSQSPIPHPSTFQAETPIQTITSETQQCTATPAEKPAFLSTQPPSSPDAASTTEKETSSNSNRTTPFQTAVNCEDVYDSDLETKASSSSLSPVASETGDIRSERKADKSDEEGKEEDDDTEDIEDLKSSPPPLSFAFPAPTSTKFTFRHNKNGQDKRRNCNKNKQPSRNDDSGDDNASSPADPSVMQMNLNAAHLMVSMEFKDVSTQITIPVNIKLPQPQQQYQAQGKENRESQEPQKYNMGDYQWPPS